MAPERKFAKSAKAAKAARTVLPLARVAEAHQLLEDRKVFGKVIVTP